MHNEKKSYLLAEIPDRRFNAGEKARVDVVDIMKSNNTEHIVFFEKGSKRIKVLLQMTKAMMNMLFNVKKNDVVMIQYPYTPQLAYKTIYGMFNFITKLKGAKKILLIHDSLYRNIIVETRGDYKKYNSFISDEEVNVISKFDAVICHNSVMAKDLVKSGIDENKIVELGIFDYLYNKPMKQHTYDNNNIKVVIAGNLDPVKCEYIQYLKEIPGEKISFELYGPGYTEKVTGENINYNGLYPPEELCEKVEGNYGLVWDGIAIDKCEGIGGRYLKYNNPHKASLYVTCGLPLIVWQESAMAKFVKEEGIGITIDNLNNLEYVLSTISKEEYENMISNIARVRRDIVKGEFLKRALKKATTILE